MLYISSPHNCAFDEPVKNYISEFVRIPFVADMEFMNHLNLPVLWGGVNRWGFGLLLCHLLLLEDLDMHSRVLNCLWSKATAEKC